MRSLIIIILLLLAVCCCVDAEIHKDDSRNMRHHLLGPFGHANHARHSNNLLHKSDHEPRHSRHLRGGLHRHSGDDATVFPKEADHKYNHFQLQRQLSTTIPPNPQANTTYWQTAYDLSAIDNITMCEKGGYYSGYNSGWLQGGGFFTNDHLYIVGCSERSNSSLYQLDILRHDPTNKVIGIDANSARKVYSSEYLDLSFRPGPGDISSSQAQEYIWWIDWTANETISYGIFENDSLTPIGSINSTEIERITDDYDDEIWGLDFHPSFLNPHTPGYGYMYATTENSIWRITVSPVLGTSPTQYEVIDAVYLCESSSDWLGDIGVIPSGPYKDNLLVPDWTNDKILLYYLDPDTGYAIDSVTGLSWLDPEFPKFDIFVENISRAWGFIWDRLTNDFFVTSWKGAYTDENGTEYDSLIHSFSGFSPGFDPTVMTRGLSVRLSELSVLINITSTRRGLYDPSKIKVKKCERKSDMKPEQYEKFCKNEDNIVSDVTPDPIIITKTISKQPEDLVNIVTDLITSVITQDGATDGDNAANADSIQTQIFKIKEGYSTFVELAIENLPAGDAKDEAEQKNDEIMNILGAFEFSGYGIPQDYLEEKFGVKFDGMASLL